MERINRLILTLIISAFISAPVYSASVWINDARSVFGSKNAIMYEVNLRTFNSKDKNGNGIIEENLGDERGTFSSAIERLDELEASGVNMLVVMPITSVGKIKAIGIFTDPILAEIGAKYSKTNARVVLKWNEQRRVIVIPKSVNESRIKENFDIWGFDLSQADMDAIAKMDLDTAKSSIIINRDLRKAFSASIFTDVILVML